MHLFSGQIQKLRRLLSFIIPNYFSPSYILWTKECPNFNGSRTSVLWPVEVFLKSNNRTCAMLRLEAAEATVCVHMLQLCALIGEYQEYFCIIWSVFDDWHIPINLSTYTLSTSLQTKNMEKEEEDILFDVIEYVYSTIYIEYIHYKYMLSINMCISVYI